MWPQLSRFSRPMKRAGSRVRRFTSTVAPDFDSLLSRITRAEMTVQRPRRTGFIKSHEPAIAGDVRHQNGVSRR
jgi:hypothetical protein